jgi:hypothetical protein
LAFAQRVLRQRTETVGDIVTAVAKKKPVGRPRKPKAAKVEAPTGE